VSDEFGLTLNEAAQQLTDRELWQAYEAAIAQAGGWRRTTYFTDGDGVPLCGWSEFAEVTRKNGLVAERDRLGKKVTHDLWQQLYRRELIATGTPLPLKPDSGRQEIPAQLFRLLHPGYRTSSLSGHGLKFVDVRVQRATNTPSQKSDEGTTGAAAIVPNTGASALVEVPPSGRPGRPDLPPEFEIELRRRAEADEMCGRLNQEANYLYRWGSERFENPKGRPWAVGTIRNRLRRIYKLLKAQKSCTK
jgi:hypothetical protein